MRVAKRAATEAIKISASRRRPNEVSLPPRWVPPQLCQLVETAPSGPQWLHEIKLDGFRMSARIERGNVQLLTRAGLDWSDKYPSVVEALAKVPANTAYLDGELCGIGDDGLPSFSQMQAATDGSRAVRLVFFAFDLLHRASKRTKLSCSLGLGSTGRRNNPAIAAALAKLKVTTAHIDGELCSVRPDSVTPFVAGARKTGLKDQNFGRWKQAHQFQPFYGITLTGPAFHVAASVRAHASHLDARNLYPWGGSDVGWVRNALQRNHSRLRVADPVPELLLRAIA